jgi:DNA ligase D-like protein (predicted 3'-phosphoesterase)
MRKRVFVVQKHHARTLHYDLRIEVEGVLKSWAVPKGVPEERGVKRLAIQTEDHPVEYADFEGEIPEGHYGAGKVEIWDKGEVDIEEFGERKIVFTLRGERLRGRYALVRFERGEEDYWLLMKTGD